MDAEGGVPCATWSQHKVRDGKLFLAGQGVTNEHSLKEVRVAVSFQCSADPSGGDAQKQWI